MIVRLLVSVTLSLFVSSAHAASVDAGAQPTPHEIISTTAAAVSTRLDGRKTYFDENPDELYALIDEVLLPHFDVRYTGYLVLGKHWKGATPEQRDRFVDVFYRFLVQSYANGILEFEQGSVEVLPTGALEAIRHLQSDGACVAYVADGRSPGLSAADVGIAAYSGKEPPWGADIVCSERISEIAALLDGIAAARRASEHGVRLSMIETALSAAMLVAEGREQAADRRTTEKEKDAMLLSGDGHRLVSVQLKHGMSLQVP